MLIKKLLLITTPELCLGVLLIFSSSIGQTFFISLFSGEIRNEFNLSHGTFGIFYSIATLMSAIVFFWLGKFADHFNLTHLALITLGILSGFSFLISSAESFFISFLIFIRSSFIRPKYGQSYSSNCDGPLAYKKEKRSSFEYCINWASNWRGSVTFPYHLLFITIYLA